MRNAGSPQRSSQGQALLEVFLGILMFFSLALVVVEVGKAFYVYNNLLTAARLGARYLASHHFETVNWSSNGRNLVVYGKTTSAGASPLLPNLAPKDVKITRIYRPSGAGTPGPPQEQEREQEQEERPGPPLPAPTFIRVEIKYTLKAFPGLTGATYTVKPSVTMSYLQPNL